MAQGANQHGAGVVIFEPARIGREHAALLDRIAKFEKAIIRHFQHPDHAELIMHLGEQMLDALLSHFISWSLPDGSPATQSFIALSAAKARLSAKLREQVTH
ncbi:hypothetical protein D3C78_1321670 [compost metagenome]